MTEPTSAEILADLRAARTVATNTDPAWKTVADWAKEWGLSKPHSGRLICEGCKAGKFRVEHLPRNLGLVGVRNTPCYRYMGKAE